jgi:hypothetical protein
MFCIRRHACFFTNPYLSAMALMNGRTIKTILSSGLLICLFGMIYSFCVGYNTGIFLNATIMALLVLRWMTLKE